MFDIVFEGLKLVTNINQAVDSEIIEKFSQQFKKKLVYWLNLLQTAITRYRKVSVLAFQMFCYRAHVPHENICIASKYRSTISAQIDWILKSKYRKINIFKGSKMSNITH